METSAELNKIKKTYGERFMKMCREYFSTILEKEGVLYEILTSSFADNSKTLYDDIKGNSLENNFKNHIYSKFNDKYNKGEENKRKMTEKTPYELLDEAGYDLFECKTEEEIQTFRKYYAPHEELCTFHDRRLDYCVVFFAVKKDVDNIKRENFKHPKREDEYGTSVMGIQFTKGRYSTVSIKNRYNHTVENPDATYGNDLEKVAPGLTESFKKMLLERGLKLDSSNISLDGFEIPNYVLANDGKYYKYNLEIGANYYCPGNVIIEGGEPIKLKEPEKRMLIDYFIIDREKKTLKKANNDLTDCFVDNFKDIEKIDVINDKEEKNSKKIILIQRKDLEKIIKIEIDKDNKIIGYEDENLKVVGRDFLVAVENLERLSLPNLIYAGDNFLYSNNCLKDVNLSNLEEVKNDFLYNEDGLENINLPKLKKVGNDFLRLGIKIKDIEIPNLEETGDGFMSNNSYLKNLYAPKIKKIGDWFLTDNSCIEKIQLPSLTKAGDMFLGGNQGLKNLKMPNLKRVGSYFIYRNEQLENLELPKLKKVGDAFFSRNTELAELNFPNLVEVGDRFCYVNENIENIDLPNLKETGDDFLKENIKLKNLKLPKLELVGDNFIAANEIIENIEMSKLEGVGDYFLHKNKRIKELNLPELVEAGDSFLEKNITIESGSLPKLERIGKGATSSLKKLSRTEVPKQVLLENEKISEYLGKQTENTDGTVPYLTNKTKECEVTSKKIAELDRENNITTSEIGLARESMNELSREQEKEIENNER